jgi:hypothetical protein
MPTDADADDKRNDATNKLTNNHVDVWNVDIVNDWNNDANDFRSDRRDHVD